MVKKDIASLFLMSLLFLYPARARNPAEPLSGEEGGWNSLRLQNGMIELRVVPEIGGRVIQYSLDNHPFFWINPELEDKPPPPGGLGPEGEWLNYGGEKIWPAPQGWEHEDQWPGPPGSYPRWRAPHRSH